jgi:hypothetical protein
MASPVLDEEWRSIPGFEGYYEASNLGRIRSCTRVVPHASKGTITKNAQLIKQQIDAKGYCRVLLHKLSHCTYHGIHRLVASAFMGLPPTGKDQCNHKDGDKTNNRIENLEWVSARENIQHAFQNGLMWVSCSGVGSFARLTIDAVKDIRDLAAEGVAHKAIAEKHGISTHYVSEIKTRRTWTRI